MIQPALTPEEWAEWNLYGKHGYVKRLEAHRDAGYGISFGGYEPESYIGTDLQAVAALCLYGQPFGFGWEDVEALRHAAAGYLSGDFIGRAGPDAGVALDSLADRIAALLPPRTP